MRAKRGDPEIVLREGKPAAVILDIERYEELLERAEDAYDLARLRALRAKRPRYATLDSFLTGRRHRA